MAILKCKPWGTDQGEYVLVDSADWIEGFHHLVDEPDEPNSTDVPDSTDAPTLDSKPSKRGNNS